MKIIKTQRDLEAINACPNFSNSVLEAVRKYFRDLYEALADGFPIEEFTLENDGHIVILEAGDDADDLSKAGISGGLVGSCPEAVERIKLKDGKEAYKISITCNNEFMITIFSESGQLDEKTEAWLKEESINANALISETECVSDI